MGWKSIADKIFVDPGPALKRFFEMVQRNPVASTLGVGTLAAAGTSFGPKAIEQEGEFMKNRLGSPDAKFGYASEKVAAQLEGLFVKEALNPLALNPAQWSTIWNSGLENLGKGIGVGIGGAGIILLTDILRKAGRGFSQKLMYDTKRKEMLRSILTMDPIISSFETQNPGIILKVYASMVSVAPNLSLDQNAVISFLREAAQTHGAVNYMTIKQLAETEKAINESQGTDLSRLKL
jgi:hypothetical protein